ncbi:MAG: polyamine aminopropyltransferase [Planctomycetota bacterium]
MAGALASYLLGDSVTQFSIAIGLYLFAMGIGSWLSKYIERDLADKFVDIELAVGLLGGTSGAFIFLAFSAGRWFAPVLYGELIAIGIMVGIEIPLLMRILKDELDFKELVAKVLSFDYVGALVVSLLFPLLLVPTIGLVRSAMVFGLANAVVGLWSTWLFADRLVAVRQLRFRAGVVITVLIAGLIASDRLVELAEARLYADDVVYSETSRYQRLTVTQNRAGFQLFLNGALQFSSADEARYHEALVHPAMQTARARRRVLVLGGGDGLALREILTYPEVERCTLVDLDPAMTRLAAQFEPLVELNHGAMHDPRVTIVNDDAMRWITDPDGLYDVIIIDFPDPSTFAIGKLYSTLFYKRLQRCLDAGGAVAIQSTSPLVARRAFWCIHNTVAAAGLHARPYHISVPSFGEWGFVLAAHHEFPVPVSAPAGLLHLDGPSTEAMFAMGPSMGPVDVEPNRLNSQSLVRYYEQDWKKWN